MELMCNRTFENKDPDEVMEYLDLLVENAQNSDTTGTNEAPGKTQPHTSSGGMYNLREDHDLQAKFASLARKVDLHHGNYNPSCKAKTNMQEDSDGPMTRARAKQLQRALTSQIGIIEAASELKIRNKFEIGSRIFICLQLELEDRKSP